MITKELRNRNLKYVRSLKMKATASEKQMKEILDEIGIKYIFQKGFLIPFHIIADFYLPKRKIIIEVDGVYHEERKKKDNNRDFTFLKQRGFRTLRIKNEELVDRKNVKDKIMSFL